MHITEEDYKYFEDLQDDTISNTKNRSVNMEPLKIKAFGKAGWNVLIGPANSKGPNDIWYNKGPLKGQIDSEFKLGDLVEITSKVSAEGRHQLTSINRAGTPVVQAPQVQAAPVVSSPVVEAPKQTSWQPRPAADNAIIVRQSVGHMTSRVLSGMMTSGIITVDQVEEQMDRIYKKFQQLVG